jgi:hypothetical protein
MRNQCICLFPLRNAWPPQIADHAVAEAPSVSHCSAAASGSQFRHVSWAQSSQAASSSVTKLACGHRCRSRCAQRATHWASIVRVLVGLAVAASMSNTVHTYSHHAKLLLRVPSLQGEHIPAAAHSRQRRIAALRCSVVQWCSATRRLGDAAHLNPRRSIRQPRHCWPVGERAG